VAVVCIRMQGTTILLWGKTGNFEIGYDVISLWWFGHRAIVDIMDHTCVDVLPEIILLTPNCNDSDISTMSGTGNDKEGSDDDSASALAASTEDSEATLRGKLDKLVQKDKKRKQQMTNLQEQLKDTKQAREGSVLGPKRVTQIKDLAEANTLPIDKQITLNNYFRDVVFRGLKLVTKEVIKNGVVVDKIMGHLQFVTDYDKKNYRVHIELALQKQIGQYRDNSVKNIKWKYRTNKGKGQGK
jgi:hypothetical protein